MFLLGWYTLSYMAKEVKVYGSMLTLSSLKSYPRPWNMQLSSLYNCTKNRFIL